MFDSDRSRITNSFEQVFEPNGNTNFGTAITLVQSSNFTIELNTALHGSNTLYRFHNGANMNANGEVVWAGNSYLRFPIECGGFEFGSRVLCLDQRL